MVPAAIRHPPTTRSPRSFPENTLIRPMTSTTGQNCTTMPWGNIPNWLSRRMAPTAMIITPAIIAPLLRLGLRLMGDLRGLPGAVGLSERRLRHRVDQQQNQTCENQQHGPAIDQRRYDRNIEFGRPGVQFTLETRGTDASQNRGCYCVVGPERIMTAVCHVATPSRSVSQSRTGHRSNNSPRALAAPLIFGR